MRPCIGEPLTRLLVVRSERELGLLATRACSEEQRCFRQRRVIGRCSDSSNRAANGHSNRCAETTPFPRSRSLTFRACWSSGPDALRTGTRALASGRKRVRERKTGCSPVSVDAGMASALLLAKCRVLSAPDDGPRFGCVAGVSIARATRPRAVPARVADVRFPQPRSDEHGWIRPR